jgi:hypothetical protein
VKRVAVIAFICLAACGKGDARPPAPAIRSGEYCAELKRKEAALIEVVLRDDVGAVRVLGRVASEGEAATAVATARQARVISKRWEPFRRDLWNSASQESVARWSPSGHRDRSR